MTSPDRTIQTLLAIEAEPYQHLTAAVLFQAYRDAGTENDTHDDRVSPSGERRRRERRENIEDARAFWHSERCRPYLSYLLPERDAEPFLSMIRREIPAPEPEPEMDDDIHDSTA